MPFMLEVRLRRSDGIAEWFCAHVSPLPRVNRSAVAWLGICTDIENYKRQGQRFAFIAKAGEVLPESLDLQTTFERLLAIIVPEFGDWAAIDLFDENDRPKTEAVIHADVRKMRLADFATENLFTWITLISGVPNRRRRSPRTSKPTGITRRRSKRTAKWGMPVEMRFVLSIVTGCYRESAALR